MSTEAPRTDIVQVSTGTVRKVGEVARELVRGYVLGSEDAIEPDLSDRAVSRL